MTKLIRMLCPLGRRTMLFLRLAMCCGLVWLMPFLAQGQNLRVLDLALDPFDTTASIQARMDLNGKKCAVIKIRFVGEIDGVDGNVIGAPVKKGAESWVYVTSGSKMLQISASKHNPLRVNFEDFHIDRVESAATYVLQLQSDLPTEILLSTGIQYAPMMTKEYGIYPPWLENCCGNGYYLGVSPPTMNRINAKRLALANALLSYLYDKGGATIKNRVELKINNDTVSYAEAAVASMENLTIEIANEFYNYRGEYFLFCKFSKSGNSSDRMRIEKSIRIHSEDGEVHSMILVSAKETGDFKLVCVGSNKSGNYDFTYSMNGESIQEKTGKQLDYESVKLTTKQDTPMAFDLKHLHVSLGTAQLDILNGLPLLPDSIKIRALLDCRSSSTGMNECVSVVACLGSGSSKALNLVYDGIEKENIRYTILGIPSILNEDSEKLFYGLEPSIKQPLTLAKQLSFYEILPSMAQAIGSTQISETSEIQSYSTLHSEAMHSTLSIALSNYSVYWQMENQGGHANNNKGGIVASSPFVIIHLND